MAKLSKSDLARDDAGSHWEGFPHGQALFPINEERVVLDAQVLLQGSLGPQEGLQGVLSLPQLVLQVVHGVGDLSNLLYQAVLHGVTAQLYVGPPQPGVKAGLGHLHGVLLVSDGLLEKLNVLLHVKDLLENLGQVSLDAVPGIGGLLAPVVQLHVDVVPLLPHLVVA